MFGSRRRCLLRLGIHEHPRPRDRGAVGALQSRTDDGDDLGPTGIERLVPFRLERLPRFRVDELPRAERRGALQPGGPGIALGGLGRTRHGLRDRLQRRRRVCRDRRLLQLGEQLRCHRQIGPGVELDLLRQPGEPGLSRRCVRRGVAQLLGNALLRRAEDPGVRRERRRSIAALHRRARFRGSPGCPGPQLHPQTLGIGLDGRGPPRGSRRAVRILVERMGTLAGDGRRGKALLQGRDPVRQIAGRGDARKRGLEIGHAALDHGQAIRRRRRRRAWRGFRRRRDGGGR